ncbi:DJ-1/PfpI family protein, partial [Exiguobacterium alkaliphilum]|uniref:DJ-1/PfpI family protein n=1 Tax=Exiguobacterium alkaliphilum TaxID=1428684 RepID=UPI003463B756
QSSVLFVALLCTFVLQNTGATVVDESVVVDSSIVTSRTPDDLEDFNRESLALLK